MMGAEQPQRISDLVNDTVGSLLHLAAGAYERTACAPSDHAPDQDDAVAAIVFSAVALEAFINQAAGLASQYGPLDLLPPEPPVVARFAQLLQLAERWRVSSTPSKFELASIVFEQPYDKGTQPYQDLALLFGLRDGLVHQKARDAEKMYVTLEGRLVVERPHRHINALRAKRILTEDEDLPWWARIRTRAVARWACNVPPAVYCSFVEMLPQSRFKRDLVDGVAEYFKPVN